MDSLSDAQDRPAAPDGFTMGRRVMEEAWENHDRSFDGLFFFGVKTTGIFCRPSCRSRPKRENIVFFPSVEEASSSGFRPCKRCRPELADGSPPGWVCELTAAALRDPSAPPLRGADLRKMGISPERARRWFLRNHGLSFASWQRRIKMGQALSRVRSGVSVDETVIGSGYASYSGMREAFRRTFKVPVGRAGQNGGPVTGAEALVPSPLGPLLSAANDDGLESLHFLNDGAGGRLPHPGNPNRVRSPLLNHPVNTAVKEQIGAYFGGRLQAFDIPLALRGTPFQLRVWEALQAIPFAGTATYAEVAAAIGRPGAHRAVARACGANPCYLVVPCHRVTGADGSLRGYGAGVWRKRALLDLEQAGG